MSMVSRMTDRYFEIRRACFVLSEVTGHVSGNIYEGKLPPDAEYWEEVFIPDRLVIDRARH